MRLTDKEVASIFESIQQIEAGELNKAKAYEQFEYKRNVSKSSYFALIDKLLVLSRLKQLGVEANIVNEIAEQMNLYYAWRLYNE